MTETTLEGQFYHYMHSTGQADPDWNRRVLEFYAPYFANCRRVLDVGCGQGHFIELLAAQSTQAEGVDSDAEMVRLCREKGLDVVQADLFDYLPQQQEQFDGIFCSNVLEHFSAQDAVRFVQLAFAALRPGGVLLVATPNPESLIVHTHEFWRDATHVRMYSRHLLEFLLHSAGFRRIASGENPITAWTPAPEWQAIPKQLERVAERPAADASQAAHLEYDENLLALAPDTRGLPWWRKRLVSLRRRLARFLVQSVMYEEFTAMERRFHEMHQVLVAIEEQMEAEFSALEPRLAILRQSLLALHQNQRAPFIKPREVFVRGLKPPCEGADLESMETIAPSKASQESRFTPVEPVSPPETVSVAKTKRARRGSLKVAVFTPYLPYPPDSGGKIRSYHLLRALTDRFDVDLYSIYYGEQPSEAIAALKAYGCQVIVFPLKKSWRTRDSLRRAMARLPRSVDYFHTPESLAQAEECLRQGGYDVVIADEICMTPYAELVSGIPRLVIRHKVDHQHYEDMARARRWGLDKLLDSLEASKLRKYEAEKMRLYRAFLACSDDDAALIHANGAADIPALVIPNGADLETFVPSGRKMNSPTLVYVGSMHYYPNVDAMEFFFEEIYESVRRAVPEVQVKIVGHSPPPKIQRLAQLPGVEVTGSVPDVRPYYEQATVFIVPLRLGGGTRLKIIEAMAMGAPVVSTTVGAEGLAIQPGQNILIADDAAAFAQSIIRLLTDSDLRKRIAEGGRILARQYDWKELTRPFADMVETVVKEWKQRRQAGQPPCSPLLIREEPGVRPFPGKPPLRIVRLVNLYPPYIVGGNEMLTRDITEALRARGYEVHILTARGRELEHLPDVHQVFNYSLDEKDAIFWGSRKLTPLELFRHHIFDRTTYRNVRRLVQQLQPDLVIADNLYMASAAPLLAVRDAPCPVMAQVADKWLLFNLVDWGMAIRATTRLHKLVVNAVRIFVQRPLARSVRLDGIVTVSDFIRGFYLRAGFPPEKLETMYLGIHTEIFQPGPPHPLHDPVRLVFVGGLWEGKGPQVIAQALRLLAQTPDAPRFHIDLFGDGAEGFKQYLRQVIREAGVESQMEFHGFAPWSRLVEAMHAADIFVFPSIWDEPFAITPLQAMGCGLPVIATRAGGTPEGFTDEETALLIPANDAPALAQALLRLAQDEPLRLRLRENGLRAVQERWSFEAYLNRLVDFYQRIIEQWKSGHR